MSRWTLRVRVTALVFVALLPLMGLAAWFALRDGAARPSRLPEDLAWLALALMASLGASWLFAGRLGNVDDLERAQSDVTDLRAIERALRDSNEELEAFSYSVSHDLRAPLAAIDGFSSALASRIDASGDPKTRHYLERIQAGVRRMEQLIEGLLGLSRVTRAPLLMERADLTQLAHEALEGLQVQQPQRRVQVRIEPGLVASCDLRLARALFDNLIGNAWKFSAGRDPARIEVGRDARLGAWFVRDDGVGFDMAHADKLFNAFQRLHKESEFPGTGIGLATVRRIVARHGGRVWAESQPGQGTTVYFTLGD